MRIIGGNLGGRRINPPSNKWPTRPTTDFAREALFNILEAKIEWSQTHMLDLFGGTGMVSLEAISRGCSQVTYVERHRPCLSWLKNTVAELGIIDSISLKSIDVKKYLQTLKKKTVTFDFIFADPPYDWPEMLSLSQLVDDANILSENGILVIEHSSKTNLSHCKNWSEDRKYGNSTFSFFS